LRLQLGGQHALVLLRSQQKKIIGNCSEQQRPCEKSV
jgi:hypothetical protein